MPTRESGHRLGWEKDSSIYHECPGNIGQTIYFPDWGRKYTWHKTSERIAWFESIKLRMYQLLARAEMLDKKAHPFCKFDAVGRQAPLKENREREGAMWEANHDCSGSVW